MTTDLEQRLRAFTAIMTLGGNFDTARAVMFEAADELARLREALKDCANPMRVLQREAEEAGSRLSGMAYSIANDHEFIKNIARTALKGPSHE